jgi:hypothetical protein
MINNLLKTTRIILVRFNGTKAILFTKNPCRFRRLLRGYGKTSIENQMKYQKRDENE